ncbi:MAG: AI-2E family transporter [Spirochaetia bacterium]|nr:AI-2E family transporter [Spirochaetia bacterium]
MKETDRSYESFLDIRKIIPWITIIFILTFLWLTVLTYRSFLMSLFISGIFYILFLKPYHFIYDRLGQRKTLASLLTTLLMILTVAIPSIFIIANLIPEISIAIDLLRKFVIHLNPEKLKKSDMVLHAMEFFGIQEADLPAIQIKIIAAAQEFGFDVLRDLRSIFSEVARFFMNFIISIFVLFYFFRNGDEIGKTIYDNFPFAEEMKSEIVERMIAVFNAVVKGNLLIAIAQGLVLGVLFWIFDLPTPILYGILGALFGLIPVVGTNIVWIPAALSLYSHGSLIPAIVFGVLSFCSYLLLENLAKPMLLDKELNLHPLILLLALLGGIAEFGIKGLILGPFSITIFLSLWQLITVWNINHGIVKK